MSIYACLSRDAMLRQAMHYSESSDFKCVKVYQGVSQDPERIIYLLFAQEIGPHVPDDMCTFEAPKDKGNWGHYFQSLMDRMEQRQVSIAKCSAMENAASIFPEEGSVFFDQQYQKWSTEPIDVNTSLADEPGYDWEIVEDPDLPTPGMQRLQIDNASIMCHPQGVDRPVNQPYRDAVLRYSELEDNQVLIENHIKEVCSRTPWRPQIVVESVPYVRQDRCYGNNVPSIYHTIDDDEEDGLWGLVDAVANDKISHGTNRVKGFTMLKPTQMAKKVERIAVKAH